MIIPGMTAEEYGLQLTNDALYACRESRKVAYQEEADPIYFEYQRGEKTREDWLEKVLEIKLRFPKP